jgi:hypothetical protein
MTLVFAEERTIPALKEALVQGRTAVWFKKQLIGKQEYLEAIFNAAVTVTDIEYGHDNLVTLRLKNAADIDFEMDRTGQIGPESLSLPAGAEALIRTKVFDSATPVELEYVVRNLLIGPDKGLPVRMTVPGRITIPIEIEIGPARD